MSREKLIKGLLLVSSVLCFVFTVVFVIWFFISESNFLEEKYWEYINWLTNIENKVASLRNKILIIFVVLLLYFVLSVFPVIPISILCVATAMVFDIASSFVINFSGISLLFSVRYFTGRKTGGGSVQRILEKSKFLAGVIENEASENPWILAVVRLLPVVPVNAVSQLFGAIDFPFGRYMRISVICFIPKMISYFIIGDNFTNPFSEEFILSMIIFSFVSGIFFLCLRSAWDFIKKVKDK